MNFAIEDGTGGGSRARVTPDNRLQTLSLTRTGDRVVSLESGKTWSLNFEDVDPTSSDDYFFYIKNTSSDISYIITDVRISSTVTGRGQVRLVNGTASGGSDVTPRSRNTGKAPVPSLTVQSGSDITGLANLGTAFYLPLDTVDKEHHLRTSGGIILEPGGAIALFWEPATGILTGTVSIQDLSEVQE